MNKTACNCQETTSMGDDPIDTLTRLRNGCPALRKVFLPDTVYPEFQKAYHDAWTTMESVVVGALRQGSLGRVTSPVHRYLLDGEELLGNVRPEYLSALQELWPVEMRDTGRMFRKSKMFLGKLVELQVAEYHEKEGWQIRQMEALGGNFDIEALSPEGSDRAIEVKYVGQPEENFDRGEAALRGECGACSYSSKENTQYLLSIVYSAVAQLQDASAARVVCLAYEKMNKWNYEEITEAAWATFLRRREETTGSTEITKSADLRVLTFDDMYEYSDEYRLVLEPR